MYFQAFERFVQYKLMADGTSRGVVRNTHTVVLRYRRQAKEIIFGRLVVCKLSQVQRLVILSNDR
jgi:hypothetical protein